VNAISHGQNSDPFGLLLDITDATDSPATNVAEVLESLVRLDAAGDPSDGPGGGLLAETSRELEVSEDEPPEPGPPGEVMVLAPVPGEVCLECGGLVFCATNNLSRVCGGCGLVVEGDSAEPEEDEGPRAAPRNARLRIVGPGSGQLQPDLYRSGEGTTSATQTKQVYDEYLLYRQMYVEAGGRAFPLNALDQAAFHYNSVQRQLVKRSLNKKHIMACCLEIGCRDIGFAPGRTEIAAFMQLPSKGTAKGTNFIRKLEADGLIDVDVNGDPRPAEIMTFFTYLGFGGDAHAPLRKAAYEVVQVATLNHIAPNSVARSKTAGATYVVLRRCKDKALVPKPPNLQEFCQSIKIRRNTVERVLVQLEAYHSYFVACYKEAGLDAGPGR
jgi:hypothetical protein